MSFPILINSKNLHLSDNFQTNPKYLDLSYKTDLNFKDFLERNVEEGKNLHFITRLAKRRVILIFPRTAGNTGNSRELLVFPGNYWEIGFSPAKKV